MRRGRIAARLGAVLAALSLTAPLEAVAQWSNEMVEVVYRDGRRSAIRASPFLGIFEDEIRLGRGGRIARKDVRFFCFKACPAELPAAPAAEDIVVWADGTRTIGPVWVGGEYDHNVVRQGDKTSERWNARYIRFKDMP